MKRLLSHPKITEFLIAALILFLIGGGLLTGQTVHAASPQPQVDTPPSPINASKVTITGTTEPEAKIIVTGGVNEIPPVYADEDGNFSIKVSLVQESTNSFFVQAQIEGEDPSEAVEVTVIESNEEAAAYEASTGIDRTAPAAPVLEDTDIETEESTALFEGEAEANITILVTGPMNFSVETDSSGHFEAEVGLTGNGVKDTYTFTAEDDAGNLSPGVKGYATGLGEGSEEEVPLEEEALIFTDISGHWAEAYILELAGMEVISGYGDGRFGPDDPITRAQILKIAELAYEHIVTNEEGLLPFNDVSSDDWFTDFVAYGVEIEIVEGYDDGTFKPDNSVNRAEALKIILAAADSSEISIENFALNAVTPNFSDVDSANDWFAIYTAFALENGVVSGYSDGTFRPAQNITRAEACKIVLEVLDLL